MKTVDLNSDLGEGFGAYAMPSDEKLIRLVSSANVACGYHAGDPVIMRSTVAACRDAKTAVGAHPGYPDMAGFGRRNMAVSPTELKAYVMYQVGALQAFCREAGVPLRHVKPHGAMYNMAAKDKALAFAIAEAVKACDPELILLGLAGSELILAAQSVGLPCASEVFADRAYQDDGSLVPRRMEGAVIHDRELAVSRTLRMVQEGVVVSITGNVVPIQADSICVHGDTPEALAFITDIRAALEGAGVKILPLGGNGGAQ